MAAVIDLQHKRQALGLAAVLEAEHAALRQFVALLEAEQGELAAPRPEELERIARAKQALVDELQQLAGQRPMLKAASLPGPLQKTLALITAAAAQARRLNEVNARLLALHSQACTARVQVLTAGAQSSTTYGGPRHRNPYVVR